MEYTPLTMIGLLPIYLTKAIRALQRTLDFLTAIREQVRAHKSSTICSEYPRLQAAIGELRWLVQQQKPAVPFQVERGDDPTGMYVLATVDVQDTDAVVDVFIDRRLELQINGGLPQEPLITAATINIVREQRGQTRRPGQNTPAGVCCACGVGM